METEILKAIATAKEATKENGEARVLLILDGLDFLLAATGCVTLEIMELVGAVRDVRAPLFSLPQSDYIR